MAANIRLTEKAGELSTYPITVVFRDEEGTLVVPDSAVFSLTNVVGEIINSRDETAMTPLASTYTIVLKGNDLAVLVNESLERRVAIEATYTSSLGTGLPLNLQIEFEIEAMAGVG